jgi:3-hydroxypropionate dehydrogenase (NADP+)
LSVKIKSVACIGAGTIGHSWATLFAAKGYNVNLYDVNNKILKNAMEKVKFSMDFLAEKGLIAKEGAEVVLNRINTTTDMKECVKEADYIQESVSENYDIKQKVFSEVDKINDTAIIASSTSGLLMTKIQKVTEKPERCIVAHPWNPPLLLKLVELVPGEKTSKGTIKITYDLMENLDKIPVVVKKEVPGFIGNRLQGALWREALSLVENGVASVEDIDRAVWAGPGARWAIMGPFLTIHLGGGPGGLKHQIENIQQTISDLYKSMDDWKFIPYHAAKKAIEQVKDLPMVKKKSFLQIVKWRDDKLVKILELQEK